MIVRRAVKNSTVVPGGGAIDVSILHSFMISLLYIIGEGASYGVDINTGGISDANFVWEPALVKVFQDSIKKFRRICFLQSRREF
ncbi:unnamed protein product [Arabidopsis halleri]